LVLRPSSPVTANIDDDMIEMQEKTATANKSSEKLKVVLYARVNDDH
jgi:hypothetical protein